MFLRRRNPSIVGDCIHRLALLVMALGSLYWRTIFVGINLLHPGQQDPAFIDCKVEG